MSERSCQASNPETCPYHGIGIAYNKAVDNYTKNPTPENFDETVKALNHVEKIEKNKELKQALLKKEKTDTIKPPNLEKLSRTVSYALRHKPENFGITLDPAGWVETKTLIESFNQHNIPLNLPLLQQIVDEDSKQRYSIVENKIRANQGHSFPVDLGLQPVQPPTFLYHGTATPIVNTVLQEGIKSMSRHAVHLSENIETATQVGSRHGEPVLLVIESQKMFESGFVFNKTVNNVWLCEFVPPQFIQRLEQ